MKTIRFISGASAIIIGEAGYSRAKWQGSGVTRLEAAMRSALESGAAYFICWNLNDQGSDSDYGVFDTMDRLTPSGQLIERVLGSGI